MGNVYGHRNMSTNDTRVVGFQNCLPFFGLPINKHCSFETLLSFLNLNGNDNTFTFRTTSSTFLKYHILGGIPT